MSMSEDSTDLELWQRTVKSDGPAFALLFERHSQAVYNHCFRRTASWSSAEDLTSIVWVEVWRRRKDARLHSDSVLPWLLAVANNCLRNFQRSQRRHRKFLAKVRTANIDDFTEDADGRLDDERRMAEVLAALSGLRIEDQEIIALCDWAGLSYAETATVLGVPIGTVRSRLSRAHGRIRASLNIAPADARPTDVWPSPRILE
jgi:RNA polymerase sigma-70 factor (ECF subfamily)